jgi:hypothetical protein
MLDSLGEADDAVQEAWLRLSRADTSGVENLEGWLTTVVARVCLDMLRSRKARREEESDTRLMEVVAEKRIDPEQEAVLAESVGIALLVVLERLGPPNGSHLCCTTYSPCCLRRSLPLWNLRRADRAAAPTEPVVEIRGAAEVAKEALTHTDRARFARAALVNGSVGIVVAPRGRLFMAIRCAVKEGRIVEMAVIADPARLENLEIAVLDQHRV